MQGLVDHGAAAGILPGATPGLGIVVGLGPLPGHKAPGADDRAVLAGVDDPLQLLGGLVHAVLQADADLHLGMGLFQVAEQLRFLGIQGNGLFAEHVAAHLHQFLGDRVVQVMGQADVDHVGLDLPHHLLVVGVELYAGGNLCRQGLIDITDGRQLHAGVAGDGVDMDHGDGAEADDRGFHHESSSPYWPKPTAAEAAVGLVPIFSVSRGQGTCPRRR